MNQPLIARLPPLLLAVCVSLSMNVWGCVQSTTASTLTSTGYAQVIEEHESGAGMLPALSGTLTTVYAYGLDLISQDRRAYATAPWQLSYYLYDGGGHVRALSNIASALTDSYTYDAFGVLIASTGTTANNYLYRGEQFDHDLHLYYQRARYLNAETGRFWTQDSYEGSPGSPGSLHKYLYANGDPVGGWDPGGHMSLPEMSMITSLTIIIGGVALVSFETAKFFEGDGPTGPQDTRITMAIGMIESAGYKEHAERARKIRFRFVSTEDFNGYTPPTFRTVQLKKGLEQMEDEMFAALVIHEVTHTLQRVWFIRGTFAGEQEAYRVQSEFMHKVGAAGRIQELSKRFPRASAKYWLVDQLASMEQYQTQNPAVTQ